MHALIESHRAEIRALAERHGLRDVRIFGSMARGDADDTFYPVLQRGGRPGLDPHRRRERRASAKLLAHE